MGETGEGSKEGTDSSVKSGMITSDWLSYQDCTIQCNILECALLIAYVPVYKSCKLQSQGTYLVKSCMFSMTVA